MAATGTITVDLLARTGSFETDMDRAARNAEKASKRIAKAANDASDGVASANKQAVNSMRMVGPQITDIVTQLQGGQNPFTILVQQGGQLKDMFGGVGPAITAVGGYLASLINPLTLTAAAVAGLGYAFYTGSKQSEAFANAIQLTGNYAGVTQGQLESLVQSMGKAQGETGKYRDVLTSLVSSGQVAGGTLVDMASAIVAFSDKTGQTTDKVTQDFLKMSDGVAKWAAEHNRQYHFLNEAQFEYIDTLEKSGQTQQAMLATAKALHDYLGQQAPQQIGILESSYRGWKSAIDGVVNSLQSIGRATTVQDKMKSLMGGIQNQEATISRLQAAGQDTSRLESALQANRKLLNDYNQQILDEQATAEKKSQDAQVQQAGIAAKQWMDSQVKAYDKAKAKVQELTEAKRQYDALLKANPNSPDAKANYDAVVSGIEEKYKPKAAPRTQTDRDTSAAQRLIQNLEAQVNEFGMGEAAILKYRLALQGIPQDVQDTAVALQGRLDSLKNEQAFQKAVTEGENKAAQAITQGATQIATSLQTAAQTENSLYNQRIQTLKDYGEQSEAAAVEANQLLEAEQERHNMAMVKINQQRISDINAYQMASAQADLQVVASAENIASQLYDVLKQSGQENSALGVAAFAAMKGLQVAQIILQTEYAAAMTQAGLTAAAATTAAVMGPAGLAAFPAMEANAVGQAMLVRALGYANAGMVAGMAIAGQRASGGPVEAGKAYIVGEEGREMFVPRTSGMIVPNDVVDGNGKDGSKLTIINNTKGRIDSAQERWLSPTERAIVIDEAVSAVAADLGNPNGRTSRSMHRNYNVQRSR